MTILMIIILIWINLKYCFLYIQDIDECKIVTSNNCSLSTSTCKNKEGGFVCECKSGYIAKNFYECKGKYK